MVSLSGFVIRVMVASENKFRSIPSSAIFWNSFRRIGSYQITAFALGHSVHEILCVPFKSAVSISPSHVELLQSSPAGLQSHMFCGLLFPVLDPQDGGLMWGSELSVLWEKLCNIIILQFTGCPPEGVWDLIIP